MQRFDPSHWQPIACNATFVPPEGRLVIKMTVPCNVYVSFRGRETLASSGQSTDLLLPVGAEVRIEGPKTAMAYLRNPQRAFVEQTGGVFTNMDRKPHESGSVLEVRKALRKHAVEQSSMLRELRVAQHQALAAMQPAAAAAAPVPVEPDPMAPRYDPEEVETTEAE